jgi:hypothetical protein
MKIAKPNYFFAAVFLISASVLAMQILQSRIFSVTTWYHMSFMVISIAMFGLTLGALNVYRGAEDEQRKNYSKMASTAAMNCGLYMLLALIIQMYMPLVSQDVLKTIFYLPVVAISVSVPYYYAGVAISLSLTRAPFPIPKIYAIDLLGAAMGCLAVIGIMELIDTPSGLLLIAALVMVSSILYSKSSQAADSNATLREKTIGKIAVIFVLLACLNAFLPRPFLYPVYNKTGALKWEWIDYEKWNSISRVTVTPEIEHHHNYLWGPSKTLPKDMKLSFRNLIIDGDASTPIAPFQPGEMDKHKYLEYDITNLAYRLPHLSNAAIIGLGGGRDLLSAKYFGVKDVVAMDVNKVQVSLLRDHPKYSNYSRLKDLNGVEMIHSEARSWFRQNTKQFDIIQMSLIDTWAATGAGAFALSENGLYTTNAWTLFLNDLKPKGVFTVSRWHQPGATNETGRLFALASATLLATGAKAPREHLFLASSGKIATLVLSKSPMEYVQINALHKVSSEMEFEILASPLMAEAEGVLEDILQATDLKTLHEITSNMPFYDMSPPNDMRPFFFNQVKFSNPIHIAEKAFSKDFGAHLGQAKATFNLFVIIVFSFLMVSLVIVFPLYKKLSTASVSALSAGTFYFFMIGLGFMFIEISLLQAFGVFMGHPIYGLSVILFSLILSTGAGSFASGKFPLNTLPKQIIWALLTFIYILILSLYLETAFLRFAEISLLQRAMVSVALVLPCGFLLGFGFPSGMLLTERIDSRTTPWFWGINGAAGVCGSALAIAVNIAMGLDFTLLVGGFCYLLLSLSFIGFASSKDAALKA